jgi:hypothetical protein
MVHLQGLAELDLHFRADREAGEHPGEVGAGAGVLGPRWRALIRNKWQNKSLTAPDVNFTPHKNDIPNI